MPGLYGFLLYTTIYRQENAAPAADLRCRFFPEYYEKSRKCKTILIYLSEICQKYPKSRADFLHFIPNLKNQLYFWQKCCTIVFVL